MSEKTLHIMMAIVMVILGYSMLEVLIWHHWLLFFIWILLPLIMYWLSGDIMRAKFSLESFNFTRRTLLGIAFFLSIVNFVNSEKAKHYIGKEFIQEYRIIQSHDCDAPEGYSPPKTCFVEDLSQVSWQGHIIVYLMNLGCVLFIIFIPIATLIAGKEGLIKKESEA